MARFRSIPIFAAAALVTWSPFALAQETAQEGSLGAGVVIGSPTGFTAKWMAGKQTAFDFGVGIGFGEDLHVHADWLFEGGPLLVEEGATLSWFVGVGARFEWDDDDDHRHNDNGNGNDDHDHDDDDVDLGPRVPIGLELRFASVRPLEIFAEVALGIEVIDDTGLTVDGGLGARWFF